MKAVVLYEHGGPEVLQSVEVPDPVPGIGEVVIRVKAISMNYNDVWGRKGLPGMKFKLPHMPGTDAAGEVVSIGPGVTKAKVGDRVLVWPAFSCRSCEACTSGHEYWCKDFRIFGFLAFRPGP